MHEKLLKEKLERQIEQVRMQIQRQELQLEMQRLATKVENDKKEIKRDMQARELQQQLEQERRERKALELQICALPAANNPPFSFSQQLLPSRLPVDEVDQVAEAHCYPHDHQHLLHTIQQMAQLLADQQQQMAESQALGAGRQQALAQATQIPAH